jgi:uncharacterized protein YqjF (DUF2071 family)
VTEVEGVTVLTPRPVLRAVLAQRWLDLCFLHWAVDPERVAPWLPPGVKPDVIDGATYVGLIGFRMVGLGFGIGPGLPWIGTFLETNVRLYSVDGYGRRAVVFRSLDASRLLAVLTAQISLRLPYKWAQMQFRRQGDEVTYLCRRRWSGSRRVTSRMSIRIGEPLLAPSPLDHFLTARWGLHTRIGRRTVHLPNEHPTWPLHKAELCHLDDDLLSAAGFPDLTDPPRSVLYSPGVPVTFGGPSLVSAV